MADEAFALSPIDARPALPTDADYEAIHEAFMETARGRWFLTEYAKRNRNADTRMVLDAVARIEATLASQKPTHVEPAVQPAASDAPPQIDLWPELATAFTRTRMEIAQRLLHESDEEAFEAIRASAETLKSISWALRERGFDARVCDFLDIQVNKITDGYTALIAESSVEGETEAEILAVFDELMQHVEGVTSGSDADMDTLDVVVEAIADAMNEDDAAEAIAHEAPIAEAAMAETTMAEEDKSTPPIAAVMDEPAPAVAEAVTPEAPASAEAASASHPFAGFHEIYGDDSDIEIVDAPIDEPPAPTELEINRRRLYEAKVEPFRSAARSGGMQAQIIAADIEIVEVALPDAEPASPNLAAPAAPAVEPAMAAEPAAQGEKPASLGHALLASGVVSPSTSRTDPLAPVRRMSQAEKIALFT
jgi:hypothetical protein